MHASHFSNQDKLADKRRKEALKLSQAHQVQRHTSVGRAQRSLTFVYFGLIVRERLLVCELTQGLLVTLV